MREAASALLFGLVAGVVVLLFALNFAISDSCEQAGGYWSSSAGECLRADAVIPFDSLSPSLR